MDHETYQNKEFGKVESNPPRILETKNRGFTKVLTLILNEFHKV